MNINTHGVSGDAQQGSTAYGPTRIWLARTLRLRHGLITARSRQLTGGTPALNGGAEIEATAAFLLTLVVYFLGAGRSLDYDSSITVGNFVATSSLLDPFRREVVLNNHPLFSFADHVVYSLGGQSVSALRVLPVGFGAATVALLAWWCARRWGLLAGAAAAVVVASNPLFAEESRAVRGYSLLALVVVVSTIIFVRLLSTRSRSGELAYTLALAVAVGTHLYGLLIIPLHIAVVVVRKDLSWRWVLGWLLAAVLGCLAYIGIVSQMWANRGNRTFYSQFPHQLIEGLLGVHWLAIVAGLALVLIALAASWPARREVVVPVVLLVVMVLGIWLVVQPVFLYPRFFVWLIPGMGVLAARAVARWPVAVVLAVACLVSTVAYESGSWVEDPLPTREGTEVLDAAAARGYQTCVIGGFGESLDAYDPPYYRMVVEPAQLKGCVVALYWPQGNYGPAAQARALLPYHAVLKAQSPFEVYANVSLTGLLPSAARQ